MYIEREGSEITVHDDVKNITIIGEIILKPSYYEERVHEEVLPTEIREYEVERVQFNHEGMIEFSVEDMEYLLQMANDYAKEKTKDIEL